MKRLSLLTLAVLVAVGMVLPVATAAAPPATNGVLSDVPVTGVLENGDPFTGTINIDEITRSPDGLLFSGTVENAAGAVVGTFNDIVGVLTPGGDQPRCDILLLDLAPIHLDVLGLVVDTSQIVIDVHAVPGAGNLLGNLLCAVTGLLDGGLLNGGLSGLLDRLLGIINNLLG
jgi:hypothetical protein